MNIEEILERIDVPPTDVVADVARGEHAVRRRRQLAIGGAAAATALVVGLAAVWVGAAGDFKSGSGEPAHSSTASPTDEPTKDPNDLKNARAFSDKENPVVRANLNAVTEILDPTGTRLTEQTGSWLEDHPWTQVQGRWRAAVNDKPRDLEVRISAGWRSSNFGCPPGAGEAEGCRDVPLPGGITAGVQEGSILTYSYQRPDGYVVALTLYGNRPNTPTGFTDEQIAAVLSSDVLDIPGNPPAEGPAMEDEVAKATLLELLGEDADQLENISTAGPDTGVTGTWTVDGQPNASFHLNVIPAEDGLGGCETNCEEVDVDGTTVMVQNLESSGVTGYAAYYPGPKQGLYLEFILKPGADELGLTKERLAEIVADESWQRD
jgi:hypothetical protein